MNQRSALLFLLMFAYLLCFPETALASARDGLLLWYHSVVPVLLPFMLLCNTAIRMHLPQTALSFAGRPISRLFGCSQAGTFAILAGFLCGFPAGAKVTADLEREQMISHEEAQFLFGFVNNLSPAFILSYLASDQLQRPELGILFLLHIQGSALLFGLLSAKLRRRKTGSFVSPVLPSEHKPPSFSFALFDQCVFDAVQNTVRLGVCIMVFSILSGAVISWLKPVPPVLLPLAASIEVTNGIHMVAASPLPFPVRFLMLNTICTFGGLSALAQTFQTVGMNRAARRSYIKSRVGTTLLAILLSGGTILAAKLSICG